MTLLRNSLLTFAATAMLGLSACTDDSTTVTPTTNKNYTPTTSGSFWVYENRTIDSTGTESTEVASRDSAVAGEKKIVGGKEATELNTYSTISQRNTNTYTYTEGSKVYNYISLSNYFPFTLPFQLTNMWVNSVDFNASGEWEIFPQQTLPQVAVPLGLLTGDPNNNTVIKFTPKLISKGKKGVMKQLTIEGQALQTQEIIATTTVNLSDIYFGTTQTGQSITFDIVNKSYFAENTGLVQSRTEPVKVPLPFPFPAYNVDGSSQILVKHSIK